MPELHAFRWTAHDGGTSGWHATASIPRAATPISSRPPHLPLPDRISPTPTNTEILQSGTTADPVRWEGQGAFIADGSDPLHDWQDWIPHAHKPHVKNPDRGFVSSANQRPADESYPYWLANGYRRLCVRVESTNAWPKEGRHTDDFRKLQLDTKHTRARALLPVLTAYLDPQSLSTDHAAVLRTMRDWDCFANAEEKLLQQEDMALL